MNGVDGAILENFSIIRFDALDAVRFRQALRSVEPPAGNRRNIDDAETPNGFEVNAAHESCANDCGA
jgi:hypothetical protein